MDDGEIKKKKKITPYSNHTAASVCVCKSNKNRFPYAPSAKTCSGSRFPQMIIAGRNDYKKQSKVKKKKRSS